VQDLSDGKYFISEIALWLLLQAFVLHLFRFISSSTLPEAGHS
jgi:multisubunit Na+/H+ antiporter MnhF subunit